MRILLIENDQSLSSYIGQALRDDGHIVDIAADGISGLRDMQQCSYELAVVDSTLPGLSGFDLLPHLRRCENLFILMLGSDDRIEARVRGLREGADDYLIKPVSLSELLARVFALGRRFLRYRSDESRQGLLRVADLELDMLRRKVTRASKPITLTAKEFSLLALLMRRQGEVLSRLVLAEQIWDMHFSSHTNLVEVAIRRLRSKVDDPFAQRLLHTVRGMGYVLEDRNEDGSLALHALLPGFAPSAIGK